MCKSPFKTLPTSIQWHCSELCHIAAGFKPRHIWERDNFTLVYEDLPEYYFRK